MGKKRYFLGLLTSLFILAGGGRFPPVARICQPARPEILAPGEQL